MLENLSPTNVFSFFEDICSIPHGSGDTKRISDYCVNFAKERELEYYQDELNNVIIKKPATAGYEAHPAVILQGHLDMVCEKDKDCEFDFLKDGLKIKTEGDYIFAEGTTLGGDDGIAVAMALAVLDSDELSHPAIEAVFTVDEETGMYGAEGLDTSLLDSKILINIDSEDEGVLTVGCAGGARVEIELPVALGAAEGDCYKITVSGLLGGHSGVEINKGRLNSNKVLAAFLNTLEDFSLAYINGGLKDNAIPAFSECVIKTNEDVYAALGKFIESNSCVSEPSLKIIAEPFGEVAFLSKEDSKKAVALLCELPNGVISMSEDIDYLVETSLNLGILKTENGKMLASFSVRSSKNTEKEALIARLSAIAERYGAAFSTHGHYPAWEYRKNSPLRDKMCEVYEKLYGKSPQVVVIHAGLECGLFSDKIKELDAVSFGPDMQDIHTPRERLSISSTARTYEYLCEILKMM